MTTYELVCLVDRDGVLLGRDALRLLDDDPGLQRMLQLLAQLLLLAQLGGVDHVAGRHISQHPGDRDVLIRPLPRPASAKVEGADDLVSQAHRDPRYASHRQAACGGGELGPPGGLLPHVGNPDHLTGVVGIPARANLLTAILRAATRYMDKVILSYNLA